MSEVVGIVKARYQRAQARIIEGLKSTPEDKLNWSPSPTSRNAVQLVVHCAMGTEGMCGMLQGQPMQFDSIQELDAMLRGAEQGITSPDVAIAMLEKATAGFFTWLDTLTPEQIGSMANLPFGPMPMAVALHLPGDHLSGHASQLEYLQTIWGDHTWRM